MSRRKKQFESAPQPGTPLWQKLALAGVVVVVVGVIAVNAARDTRNTSRLGPFAACLTQQGIRMYGAWWCPHCTNQKALFGEAFSNIEYIECSSPGKRDGLPVCTAAGVQSFPQWFKGNEKLRSGEWSLEELSKLTGCPLPDEEKAAPANLLLPSSAMPASSTLPVSTPVPSTVPSSTR